MKITALFAATLIAFSLTACTSTNDSENLSLKSVLAQNILSAHPSDAIKVTDHDDSLSAYYNDKKIESVVTGYCDGKPMSIISGYDEFWESDFIFYLYNGNAYSMYPQYDDDVLRYADLTMLNDLDNEYPASQFYFLDKWSPTVVDTKTADDITTVVYEVTIQDDEDYANYFASYYEDLKPAQKLYFELELNSKQWITSYSLNRDKDGANPVWEKYDYSYVPFDDYNTAHIIEVDSQYEQKELVTMSLVDSESGDTTAQLQIQKGAPFYAELSADEVLYLDKECTQSYLEFVLKYTQDNGKQYAIESDTTLYIGAK